MSSFPTISTSKSHKTAKCEEEDLDVTFVAGSSNVRNGDGPLEKRMKDKRKHQKIVNVSSTENEYVYSVADESFSESILKTKKKKSKKQAGDETEHSHNVQSDSFLNGISLTESLETDSSVNGDLKKRKKKKHENHCNPLKKKRRTESIEFLTQDIFKESEADSYIPSTPIAKKAKKNKKRSRSLNNGLLSDEKKEPVYTNAAENSSSERNEENSQNGSLKSLNESKENSTDTSWDSELHTKIELSDFENGHSSNSNDNEIISPNKIPKKKKSNTEVGPNSQNEQNEDNMERVMTKILDDKSAADQIILKKKKKKHKDIADAGDPWRDSVSPEFSWSKQNKKRAKDISHVDPLHDSVSSEFNSSKNDKKESKESVFQNVSAPFEYIDVMKLNETKRKLGLYSPSHSATLDNSGIQEVYNYDNISKRSSADLGNTSYVNSIHFTDDSKEEDCSFSSDDDSHSETSEGKSALKLRGPLLGKYFDVDFKIPELHKILNRASKPTAVQRELIAAEGIKVKQGKFIKAEDKQIRENWKRFVEITGLEDKPEYFFRLDKHYISPDSKRNFLYYLARDMPERTPYAVYKRFKLIMAENKKGRYTSEENEFIKKMMQQKESRGYCVKKIAEHLQRPAASIEKRIKKIREAHVRKIKWKGSNAAAFIKYLLKVTKTPEENISHLKEQRITHKDWEALSKKLDNVPVRILRRVWLEKLYPSLFIPGIFCDLAQVKLKLVEMLHENNETEWKYVNWNHYASQFEGLTSLRIYSLMKQLVKAFVPEHKRDNLKRCIKTLMKISDKSIPSHIIHKIEYTRGTVRELREKM